jgi:hypothetical protein
VIYATINYLDNWYLELSLLVDLQTETEDGARLWQPEPRHSGIDASMYACVMGNARAASCCSILKVLLKEGRYIGVK